MYFGVKHYENMCNKYSKLKFSNFKQEIAKKIVTLHINKNIFSQYFMEKKTLDNVHNVLDTQNFFTQIIINYYQVLFTYLEEIFLKTYLHREQPADIHCEQITPLKMVFFHQDMDRLPKVKAILCNVNRLKKEKLSNRTLTSLLNNVISILI